MIWNYTAVCKLFVFDTNTWWIELLILNCITSNYLTVCSFKNNVSYKLFANKSYTCVCVGKYRNKSDNMKKIEKKIQNLINLLWLKVNVKRFGFNNLHTDIKMVKNVVWTAIDVYQNLFILIKVHIYVCVCVCVFMRVYICVYMYIYMYI